MMKLYSAMFSVLCIAGSLYGSGEICTVKVLWQKEGVGRSDISDVDKCVLVVPDCAEYAYIIAKAKAFFGIAEGMKLVLENYQGKVMDPEAVYKFRPTYLMHSPSFWFVIEDDVNNG